MLIDEVLTLKAFDTFLAFTRTEPVPGRLHQGPDRLHRGALASAR
jgi:hypothetical protein